MCGFVYCNLKALVSLGHTLVLHASCSLLPLLVAREYDACNVVQPEREPRHDLSLSETLGLPRSFVLNEGLGMVISLSESPGMAQPEREPRPNENLGMVISQNENLGVSQSEQAL